MDLAYLLIQNYEIFRVELPDFFKKNYFDKICRTRVVGSVGGEKRTKFRTGAGYDRMITVMTRAEDWPGWWGQDTKVYLDAVAQFRVSNLSVVHGHWLIDWWKSVAFPASWLSPSALLHTHPTNQIAAASTNNEHMAMVNSWHACNMLVQQRSGIRQFPNKVKINCAPQMEAAAHYT